MTGWAVPPSAGDEMRAVLMGAVRDAMDIRGHGIEQQIDDYLDLFDRFPEAKLRMRLAAAAHIPYSEACIRWDSADDLAAEVAWQMIQAADSWDRCRQCGTTADEVLTEDRKRPLTEPIWQLHKRTCWTCQELARARRSLDDVERQDGTDFVVRPRPAGGPWKDED